MTDPKDAYNVARTRFEVGTTEINGVTYARMTDPARAVEVTISADQRADLPWRFREAWMRDYYARSAATR